jgi:CheY-like chemotaxis protein
MRNNEIPLQDLWLTDCFRLKYAGTLRLKSEQEGDVPIEILLVEDNVGDIRLTQEAFRPANNLIFLHVVSDGAQAMTFLRQQGGYDSAPRPDLILLDLNLPVLDGRNLLSDIKRDSDLKSIPVFVVTASERKEDVVTSYENGADGFHRKPVQWKEFEALVNSLHDFWVTKEELQVSDG